VGSGQTERSETHRAAAFAVSGALGGALAASEEAIFKYVYTAG